MKATLELIGFILICIIFSIISYYYYNSPEMTGLLIICAILALIFHGYHNWKIQKIWIETCFVSVVSFFTAILTYNYDSQFSGFLFVASFLIPLYTWYGDYIRKIKNKLD